MCNVKWASGSAFSLIGAEERNHIIFPQGSSSTWLILSITCLFLLRLPIVLWLNSKPLLSVLAYLSSYLVHFASSPCMTFCFWKRLTIYSYLPQSPCTGCPSAWTFTFLSFTSLFQCLLIQEVIPDYSHSPTLYSYFVENLSLPESVYFLSLLIAMYILPYSWLYS